MAMQRLVDIEVDSDFNIHTSYHNDFFLLRTRVLVNEEKATIKSIKEGSYEEPVLNFCHGGTTISTKLWSIVNAISSLLRKFWVYHVDTFYYEQSPLFHVVFSSESCLHKFLEKIDNVRCDIELDLLSIFLESMEMELPCYCQVVVEPELFLVSPNQQNTKGAELCPVNIQNCFKIMARWKDSKLFDFESLYGKKVEPPRITVHPQELKNAFPGKPVTFSIQVTGTEPLYYHWEHKTGGGSGKWKVCGVEKFPGRTLTIPSVQKSNEGSYRCIVENDVGSDTSKCATLTVGDISDSTPLGPIQGVEVIGVTEFTVSTEGGYFEWKGYGLKLHVPEKSVPGDMEEARVNIRASLSGQFQLPEGSDLLSPVFWISAPCKSTKPVRLEIQHCALREHEAVLPDLSFVSAIDSQRTLPYRFKQLDGGVFTKHSSYGSIQLNHFCGIGVVGRKSTPRSYCAHLYHNVKQIYDWRYYLAITQDLEAFKTVVENHFHKFGAKLDDISLDVEFLKDEITLNFPEGKNKEGWEITPRTHPMIAKRKVDNFKEGQSIPHCQLMMVWKGDGTPVRLVYKIVLDGASTPNNYLLLVLDPAEAATNGMQDFVPESPEQPNISGKPELKDLTGALNKVAHRWMELGIYLQISKPRLNSIETNFQRNPERCLVEMLDIWLQQQVDPPPRWGNIIDAVEYLEDRQLGRELRQRYGI